MIDTHAHLQDEKYENVEEIIFNAQKDGIQKIVCASANLKTSQQAVALSCQHDCVFATVGVHPEDAGEWCKEVWVLPKSASPPLVLFLA